MNSKKILLAWIFWLVVWQIAANQINMAIFLPSPTAVIVAFYKLLFTAVFWHSIGFTFSRIVAGFLMGVICAIILASLAYKSELIEILLKPLMITIKSVPVASFIILVLIWFSTKNLSILISFLMVLPVIYTNILQGLKNIDRNLMEMAQVFQMKAWKQFQYIYVLQVEPYFKSAILVAMGLSFKAGIAAEVIGLPNQSIGEQIYKSKIYLNTVELFAWTVVVILMSFLFEKIVMFLLHIIINKIEQR